MNDHTNSLLKDLEEEKENVNNGKVSKKKEVEKKQTDLDFLKAVRLLSFEEAPEYLKHNPFILTGYRSILNTDMCIQRLVGKNKY